MFNTYFYSAFTQAETNQSLPTDNSSHFSSINITEEDVYNALINLDTSKAMGPDGIPSIVLSKCASVATLQTLHHLFSLILRYTVTFKGTGRFTRSFLYLNLEIPLKLKVTDPLPYFAIYLKFSRE